MTDYNMEVRIKTLKQLLSQTDYQSLKFNEGDLSEEEFAPIREQRREWRMEINDLEERLLRMRGEG